MTARAANRVISPTDYASGIIGAHATGVFSLIPGVGIVGGLASALAHHYVRERGASTAAIYLDKISKLGAVRKAVQNVDDRVAAGIAKVTETQSQTSHVARRLVSQPGREATSVLTRGGGESYAQKRAVVAAAAANADQHRAAVDAAASAITSHAPLTSGAFRSAAIRATSYLAHAIPALPAPKSILPQRQKDHEPDPESKARFVRQFDAVNDPVSLLDHAHAGTITADQVDAVRQTHPELLAEIQRKTVSALADIPPGTVVPQAKKESISVLLGQPVDESVSPEFASAMQTSYPPPMPAAGPKPGPKTGRGAPKRKIKAAYMSGLDSPYSEKE